jgi:hypothetical protein
MADPVRNAQKPHDNQENIRQWSNIFFHALLLLLFS